MGVGDNDDSWSGPCLVAQGQHRKASIIPDYVCPDSSLNLKVWPQPCWTSANHRRNMLKSDGRKLDPCCVGAPGKAASMVGTLGISRSALAANFRRNGSLGFEKASGDPLRAGRSDISSRKTHYASPRQFLSSSFWCSFVYLCRSHTSPFTHPFV